MTTLADLTDEARRVVEAAEERGIIMRLLGGVAIRMHSPSATHRSLARGYPDLDFAMAGKRSRDVENLLVELGYVSNKTFNLLNGDRRMLFYDEQYNRQVDIFVGSFHMCHHIPITKRIAVETLTLPLAELLLTKMQIVQMNEKDVRDLCALLIDHPFGEGDEETINLPYIAQLCAEDWGLWKTVNLSIKKVRDFCDAYTLDAQHKLVIIERLGVLRQALEEVPKTFKWKVRDKIGEMVKWYELPEEVQRG